MKNLLARIRFALNGNRLLVKAMKYIPVICTGLVTIHIALLLLGFYEPVTISLCVILCVALLILLSVRFRFCKLHLAMVVYMALMTMCVCIQKLNGFGSIITAARLVMLILGMVLFVLAIIKGKSDGCSE